VYLPELKLLSVSCLNYRAEQFNAMWEGRSPDPTAMAGMGFF
jgi:hypothetical protein